MNVDSILISDYAAVSERGALSVFKTFNRIRGEELPAHLPMMCISLIIHAHPSEGGSQHEIEIRLLNSRRKEVVSFPKRPLQLPPADDIPPGLPLRAVQVQAMMNLKFEEAGPYAFEVYIDGTYHAGAAFYVGSEGS